MRSAGRLEKYGLELSLKVGHLVLENSVTMLYHIPVFIIAPGQRGSTESSIIESIMTCIIKFCLSDFMYLNIALYPGRLSSPSEPGYIMLGYEAST